MRSERRLHPLSFLFGIGGQLRELLLPGLLVIFTAGSAGGDWQAWLMLLVIPYSAVAIGRCLSYRYRFDDTELVVRTGFLFRNERRIPYARIQNVDAVQQLLHRLAGVVEVRVQTGGGTEPEATMRVLPLAALDEMRERVFQSGGRVAEEPGADARDPGASAVLRLPLPELLLSGFIENRGSIVIATGVGLLWEAGVLERVLDVFSDDGANPRGFVRPIVRALTGGGLPPAGSILLGAAVIVVLLVLIRLVSTVESAVRLHGFTLTRSAEDLRAEYGLLTRVTATIPLRRIQLLVISESPLHRLLSRAAVRVDTAGGETEERGGRRREALAPIVRRPELSNLLAQVLPGIDLEAAEWRPPARGAARRAFNRLAVVSVLAAVACSRMLGWGALGLLAALLGLSVFFARRHVASLGWAVQGNTVLFRSGWLWRHTSVARFSRVQSVVLTESPFDRRTGMAAVAVDTAGGTAASQRIHIPFMPRDAARDLHAALAAQAAQTAFRW